MQQAYEIQQEVLLMDTARIYRRGLNRPDLTLEDTKQVRSLDALQICLSLRPPNVLEYGVLPSHDALALSLKL